MKTGTGRRVVVVISLVSIVLGTERNYWNRIAYKKENPLDPTLHDVSFFQRIQSLNLGPEEILSSYKNISAQVKTENCLGICKSTAALWLLQELSPCDNIEKADCPMGLLCCRNGLSEKKEGQISDFGLKTQEGNDGDLNLAEDHTRVSYVPYSNNGSDELYYPEPILDPIPNDERFETLKL